MDPVLPSSVSPPLSPDRQPPRLLCIDGPPGSGKTRLLTREACRLAADGQKEAGILLLAVSPLNAQRLQSFVKRESDQSGLSPADRERIRVLRLEAWLLSLLKEFESRRESGFQAQEVVPEHSASPISLLDDHEAAILLHEILQEETPPGHPLAHAARHPATARALWDQFRYRQAHVQDSWKPEPRKTAAPENNHPSESGADDEESPSTLIRRVYARLSEQTAEAGLISRANLANRVLRQVAGHSLLSEAGKLPESPQADILRKRYGALLVDEAQELSDAHHALLARLRVPLVLAGNADLSIRSFRGASPARFTDLSPYADFSVERIRLSASHRSDETVKPLFLLENDPEAEALAVADALARFVSREPGRDRPARWSDCAILLRSARFKGELTAALRRCGIPFQSDGSPETPFGLHQAIGDFFRNRLPESAPEPVAWLPLWQELAESLSFPQNGRPDIGQADPVFGESPEADGTAFILDSLKQRLLRLDTLYRTLFQRPLSVDALLTHLPILLEKAREAGDDNSELSPDAGVCLLSLHQAQGEEFPCVVIPFFVADEFPRTRDWPELLSGLGAQSIAEPDVEAEEARLLTVGLTRATQCLIMSAHRTEAGEAVQPSPWYEALKRDSLYFEEIETPLKSDRSEQPEEDYTGDSLWATLERQVDAPVFDAAETLSLSASAIKTYMTCPRQFYYRRLLRLPQPGSLSATAGSLTHRLLEVFNRTATPENYTVERLKSLIETLFRFHDEPDAFAMAGFTERDARQLAGLSPLARSALRERLSASADDLARKGYFRRYAQFQAIEPEKPLQEVALPGLDRIRLTGVVDALIQSGDGRWDILDYKTFGSAYSSRVPLCEDRFRAGTLAPLPDENTLGHGERFADRLSANYPTDYQLPLYYLALSRDPAYQGRLSAAALQLVRPAPPDNPEQGAIRLEISAAELEAAAERLVSDVRRFIAEPILAATAFHPAPRPAVCDYCPYTAVCDAGELSNETNEAP